ncbi:MAG: response regulator [Planctomycetes bacterium]|nr:response regulator [Planctomycetota bacterium]
MNSHPENKKTSCMTECECTAPSSLPAKLFTITIVFTVMILGGLGWYTWSSYQQFKSAESGRFRLIELSGVIMHLDEVLTMSSHMAAVTGESQWEMRYQKFAPRLTDAVNEAMGLAHDISMSKALAQVEVANVSLSSMSEEAFDLITADKRKAAVVLIGSEKYDIQKRAFSDGITKFTASMPKHVKAELENYRHRALVTVLLIVAILPPLIFAWVGVLSVLKKYMVARKEAEEKIANTAKFPSEDPNPVLRISRDGTVLYCNKPSAPLLNAWGYKEGGAIPERWFQYVLNAIGSGLTGQTEIECDNRTFSLTFAPVMDGGYVNIYASDITDRKRAEEELKSLNKILEIRSNSLAESQRAAVKLMNKTEEAKRDAERVNRELKTSIEHANQMTQEAIMANQAKSEFLANISHEIRTPMNAILCSSQLLSEENLTGEQKSFIDVIQAGGENLLEVINDVLDFSKIEAGKLDIETISCSLGQMLDTSESLMRMQANEKGLDFKIFKGKKLPERILTDPGRVHQCLSNLINNAIKFTERGYVYINVSLEEIEDKPFIRFDVEDTGVGIPANRQEAIFESFTQADGSTTRKFGGTGLGLSITKRLAELLGGKLTLSSEEGKGSVFTLMIPAGVDVKTEPVLGGQNIPVSQPSLSKDKPNDAKFSGHVLVAEDSQTNQTLIKLLLKRLGLEVTIAQDGDEAVQKALTQSFDMIFMDIQMPNMNGYEATKLLRRRGVTVPIVALTAYVMKVDERECVKAGCDNYLSKPINRKKLLQVIAKYLPIKGEDISEKIDSIKSQVDEVSQFYSKGEVSEKPVDKQNS